MPRYYFHVLDDLDTVDDEGAELPDLHSARQAAIRSARHLMCETLTRDGRITLHHRIEIEDEEREVVDTVPFGGAVRIES